MLCSLQKRLKVSASHRDAPSSSGPSATERNKGTHSFCCAEREAGWEPAVPALLRQDEVPCPWDHPATPARAGDTAPTAARPTPAAWGNSRSAVGQQERQRQVPSGLLRSCWALGSPRCSRQQNGPALPPARQPRAPAALKQNSPGGITPVYPGGLNKHPRACSAAVCGATANNPALFSALLYNPSLRIPPNLWGLLVYERTGMDNFLHSRYLVENITA